MGRITWKSNDYNYNYFQKLQLQLYKKSYAAQALRKYCVTNYDYTYYLKKSSCMF